VTHFNRNGIHREIYSHETLSDYFSTIGLRIVRGRAYTPSEGTSGARVVVVSETMARDFWPGQDPVGKTLVPFDESTDVVIGIASDAITAHLREGSAAALYRPLRSVESASIVARTDGAPEAVVPAIRATLQPLDPRVRLDVSLVASGLQGEREEPRILATLASGLAILALGLAIVGIYGVTACVTGLRTREMGLRIAVGASRGDVMRLLLWESLRPVAIGLAAGAVVVLLVSQLLVGVLYGVSARDPLAFATASAVLLLSAAAAVFMPTRRVARVDPAFVLRQS
jgi:hypothetical protein